MFTGIAIIADVGLFALEFFVLCEWKPEYLWLQKIMFDRVMNTLNLRIEFNFRTRESEYSIDDDLLCDYYHQI